MESNEGTLEINLIPGNDKWYLGDAVWASHDGYLIWLTTTNGIKATNRIALDPTVFGNLMTYQEFRESEKEGCACKMNKDFRQELISYLWGDPISEICLKISMGDKMLLDKLVEYISRLEKDSQELQRLKHQRGLDEVFGVDDKD